MECCTAQHRALSVQPEVITLVQDMLSYDAQRIIRLLAALVERRIAVEDALLNALTTAEGLCKSFIPNIQTIVI